MNRKSTEILARFFYIVCQMKKAKNISSLQECLDQNAGPYTLKKAGPEMFSFWVNNISAEKQVLFDICGPIQSQQSSIRMSR